MKQVVREFYAANKTPMAKMVSVGVKMKSLSGPAIEAAAEMIYDEVKKGREIRPIRLVWEVFSRAKIINAEIQRKTDWYAQPWWKIAFRRFPSA